jgi:hypothetical protein
MTITPACVSRSSAVVLAAFVMVAAVPRLVAAQGADPSTPPPVAESTPPAATPAPAANTAPQEQAKGFWESTEIGGLLDVYYDYYSTQPSGDAQYRNFDTKHNQFNLSMAEIWIAKAPTSDSRAGLKLRGTVGSAANLINAYEPGGADFLKNLEEGYVSYLAPVGKGLQVDFGKFTTPIGAEVIEAKDNWNYSRSLLFALAIPYYHTGLRLSYSPNGKVTVLGTVVNGWNNFNENNSGKTYGAQVSVKPSGALTIVQNYMTGPEQPSNTNDWRQLSDTIVTFTASPSLSVMANYDYGHDTVGGIGGHWQGIAGYARFQANKVIAIAPRFEWYDDHAGFTTGAVQTLKEATITLEAKALDSLLCRLEYRGDFSDQNVFKEHDGTFRDHQHSIGVSMLYFFSVKGK